MFTPREVEVCERLRRGMGDKAIAADLGISTHTVNFHLRNIFGKLRVHSRLLAMVRARRFAR